MSVNKFVFVVCGGREHIDTLHFSLRYLKHFSSNEIIVVTDSLRNAIAIEHDLVVDVKTPEHFNHHQASIYLKTGLNKFLPKGFIYCYLDTDVVALNAGCDDIFKFKQGPVTFAADHCRMPEFSLSAVKCDCVERNNKRMDQLEAIKDIYDPARQWQDPVLEEKKRLLEQKFVMLRRNKLKYLYVSIGFITARYKFKLDDDTFFDKRKKAWHDKGGNIIMAHHDDMFLNIEKNSGWRWNKQSERWIDPEGYDIHNLVCPHLAQYIFNRFGVEVKDPNFQHWNGGVFLFDDDSEAFLNAWFDKTMQIFTWPEWKVRDQGTLIATVWQFGLQHNPLLPKKFNFISDWNNANMMLDEAGNFTDDGFKTSLRPSLIHIYHNFGKRGWSAWDYVAGILPADNTALEDSLYDTTITKQDDNKVVNGLWIGDELSAIELLTLHSFVRHGHTFNLWLYGPLKNELPDGVVICDANEIMPASSVFRYQKINQYGHGKGSVSGFSDIFRYKLLYEKGGWWVDMDVTCLHPFNIRDAYFFRNHHDLNIVGNVMKCPPHSELMRLCYEEAVATVNAENTDWHKPVKTLNKYVKQLKLTNFIHSGYGNADIWKSVERYIYGPDRLREAYLFVHWMNEEWRTRNIDRNDIPHKSALGKLLLQYKLVSKPVGHWAPLKQDLRFLWKKPRLYSGIILSKTTV